MRAPYTRGILQTGMPTSKVIMVKVEVLCNPIHYINVCSVKINLEASSVFSMYSRMGKPMTILCSKLLDEDVGTPNKMVRDTPIL